MNFLWIMLRKLLDRSMTIFNRNPSLFKRSVPILDFRPRSNLSGIYKIDNDVMSPTHFVSNVRHQH